MIYLYLILTIVKIVSCQSSSVFNTSSWGVENKLELEQLIHQCENEETLVKNVAFMGDVLSEYRISLREVNLKMRLNYDDMIRGVGNNIYPLIVVNDADKDQKLSGIGSEYTLYMRNGSIKSMKPTSAEYETNKDLAHVPMGIFSIISRYFLTTNSTGWKSKLHEYREMLDHSLRSLRQIEILKYTPLCTENLEKEDQEEMLKIAINFIDSCFIQNSSSLVGFKEFAQNYLPYTKKALKCAVEVQSKSALPHLMIWKSELGDAWNDLYVIIPVIWPVAGINPRQLLFEKIMNPEKIKTNIIKAENLSSYLEMRSLLGRIVADRTMSHYVFGHNSKKSIDMHMSLSTRRDLTASEALALNLTQQLKLEDLTPNMNRFGEIPNY